MIDLRYLSDFLDLAATGNFSTSARNRSISQPALTRRIQQLEEWSGRLLFDRSKSPLTLTAAGEEFRPVAELAVSQLQAFRARAGAHASARAPLKCISLHALGGTYLSDWLDPGRAGHAKTAMEISFGTYDQCFSALRENQVDIAVVYHCERVRDARFKALSRVSIGKEVFVPVASAAYARGIRVRAGQAQAAPILVELSRDNYLGKALSSASDRCTRRLGYVSGAVAARIDAVRGLVDAGCGIGWLPASMVRAELDNGALHVIEDPSLRVEVNVVVIAVSEEKLEAAGHLFTPCP